jgi:hypothetical protein
MPQANWPVISAEAMSRQESSKETKAEDNKNEGELRQDCSEEKSASIELIGS